MKLEIYLIRHGKTAGNLRGAYIGTTDEPLCKEGIRELESFRQKGNYPPAERVASSDLLRCVETARLLYPKQEIRLVPGLQECGFGAFEGKNYQELNGNPDYQRWIDSGGAIPFPPGEDPLAFRERCWSAFQALCEAMGDSPLAVVCHGGTIMSVLEQCGEPAGDFYRWQVPNGEGFRFVYDTITRRAAGMQRLGVGN